MGDSQDTATGLSRRDLIKRSAVAGGLVWATPMLLSSKAGAQAQSACPSGSCTIYHRVKIETNDGDASDGNGKADCGKFVDVSQGGGDLCPFTTPAGAETVAVTCATFNNSHVESVVDSGSGDNNLVTITLKPGYQFDEAYSKKGGNCNAATFSNNCRTASFSPSSHLEFSYCGPT